MEELSNRYNLLDAVGETGGIMTIKEVSEKYNISQDTLRYYERVKMIPEVTRTAGGIRDYQEEDLRWVELAICELSNSSLAGIVSSPF